MGGTALTSADVSIAAVLEHYGADLARVRETGWRPVKCPFHEDSHASATVNLAKGGFACHGCGAKGDAIGLIREREGLDFAGALEWARDVLGASTGDVRAPDEKPKPRERPDWLGRLL